MTTGQQRCPSRHQQRRIRIRQLKTGKSYLDTAQAIRSEYELARRYLRDAAVPPDLTATLRGDGLIPLELLNQADKRRWRCRCTRCDEVVIVRADSLNLFSPNEYWIPQEYWQFLSDFTITADDLLHFHTSLLHFHPRDNCDWRQALSLAKIRRVTDEL
jgi:hypothetical protein